MTHNQLEKDSDEESHLFGHGRLSYIQIPAINVDESAKFYEEVFGWQVREGTANHVSFVDTTGDMIGAWITGLATSQEPGVLPYIYVHGVDAILKRIAASGGEIIKSPYAEGDLLVATFRDPAGNVIGVWQGEALSNQFSGVSSKRLQRTSR